MTENQQRNDDLQERLIDVLDVVESLPNSIPSFSSSLHHSMLDIRYSILTAKELHSNTITALLAARAANTPKLIHHAT